MNTRAPILKDADDSAEARALAEAVAQSDADESAVPHDEMRDWLLRIASGEFTVPPPVPR